MLTSAVDRVSRVTPLSLQKELAQAVLHHLEKGMVEFEKQQYRTVPIPLYTSLHIP